MHQAGRGRRERAGSAIQYSVRVADDTPPGTALTNRVSVSSAGIDSDTADNAATATVTTVSCTISGAGDIAGTEGDDVICGSVGPDRIAGLGGNDIIFGLGGNDQLGGDAGNDRLFGGDGDDRLAGGAGDDVLLGNAGFDYGAGNAGFDLCAVEVLASCEY